MAADRGQLRVLLVDDHAAFREPLRRILEFESDLTVVGEAGSLAEASCLPPADVGLVDLMLPDGSGVDLIAGLSAGHCRVIVLTGSIDETILARAAEAGARGVLRKTGGLDAIIDAIRTVGRGEWLFTPVEVIDIVRRASAESARRSHSRAALNALTARERQILAALGEGLSDKDIAYRLGISPDTARNHMANVLAKLGVESRLQAVIFAVRHGAVEIR
jgi:DNA-binding NarL/FixJ family response regulator